MDRSARTAGRCRGRGRTGCWSLRCRQRALSRWPATIAASTDPVKVVKAASGRMSAQKHWSIAVAGCGTIGRLHVRAFKELGAEVVAVSSRRAEQARAVAEEEGCEGTTDAEALVRRPDVDLVSITTSSGSHARLALAAIAAGKHVVVQKPRAITPLDLGQLLTALASPGSGVLSI